MRPAYEPYPAGRSPFAAAFLSLLFPGLGHAYLGAHRRAIAFAAPPILIAALVAGIAVRLGIVQLAGLAVQTWFIAGLFVVNIIALAYRGAAIIDAWLVGRWLSRRVARAAPGGGPGRQASVVGLAVVLAVMSLAHLAVARYDLVLAGTTSCVFDPGNPACGAAGGPDASAGPSAEPSLGPAVSASAAPPWNGRDRLNILLLGADEQDGAHNTDTMITVSIDPATNQVVMFSLPRDTANVPVPPGPARNAFGPVYSGKINAWFSEIRDRPDLFPGTSATRGYNGLKAMLGELYGLDIRYYVEVNFSGFEQVVNALGGVTINVQIPLLDDAYPQPGGILERLYVPAGVQHMNGTQALAFSRSRKTSSDFDRAARQQRVLLSLRNGMDPAAILPRIDALADALKQAIRTDVPRELVPQLLEVAERIGSRSVRSVIFAPPFYGEEVDTGVYYIEPNVERIRTAVREAFTVDPAFAQARDAIAAEGATIWVLNGSGITGQATAVAGYLEANGLDASAPNRRPETTAGARTVIRAYNGAEERLPLTIAALSRIFGVEPTPVADPAASVDIEIVTAKDTPALTPPPAP